MDKNDTEIQHSSSTSKLDDNDELQCISVTKYVCNKLTFLIKFQTIDEKTTTEILWVTFCYSL